METICPIIKVTATPRVRQQNVSTEEAPHYEHNQVTTAVNCSLEPSPEVDPSDWKVDFASSPGLYGYLQQHAYTTVAPSTALNRFRMLRERPQTKEIPPVHFRKQSETPVLTVLLTQQKQRKRHRKVASLVHNPLSAGMAKLKAKQLQAFTCPLSLGPLIEPVVKARHRKRCVSVVQETRPRRLPEFKELKLSGMALTLEHFNTTQRFTPRLSLAPQWRTMPR